MKKSGLCYGLLLMLISCSHQIKRPEPRAIPYSENTDKVRTNIEIAEKEIPAKFVTTLPKKTTLISRNERVLLELRELPPFGRKMVAKWENYFQTRGREHMVRYLSRSSRYLDLMKDILNDYGLPEDLVYIPLIESGFQSHVRSHAAAVGYWQFIRGTGKQYGLRIDSQVDERRDPILATQAAAKYLKGLYNLFGSWDLAIPSYNVGENKVKNRVMRYYTRDFWKLAKNKRLPLETINYLPKFIAARNIAKDPGSYGFKDIPYMKPFSFSEIQAHKSVDLLKLARNLSVSYSELKSLNPAYKRRIAPKRGSKKLIIRIPDHKKSVGLNAISKSYSSHRTYSVVSSGYHKVRRGENLYNIARKYGVSLSSLLRKNRMRRSSVLFVGKTLKIPGTSRKVASRSKTKRRVAGKKRRNPKVHVVRRGDTLIEIANKYRTSVGKIVRTNKLNSRSKIFVGTRLIVSN